MSLYSGWKMISLNTLSSFIFKNTFSSTETESATDIKTDLNISLFLILSFQFGYYGVCYISKVKILLSIIKRGRYKKLFLHNVRMCYFKIKASVLPKWHKLLERTKWYISFFSKRQRKMEERKEAKEQNQIFTQTFILSE